MAKRINNNELRTKILDAINNGADKRLLCSRYKISVRTVNRWLKMDTETDSQDTETDSQDTENTAQDTENTAQDTENTAQDTEKRRQWFIDNGGSAEYFDKFNALPKTDDGARITPSGAKIWF